MARRLRAERGMPMKAIAAELGVSVSSVSLWTRDIELSPEQREALREADVRAENRIKGNRARAQSARKARVTAQVLGRVAARADDPLAIQEMAGFDRPEWLD